MQPVMKELAKDSGPQFAPKRQAEAHPLDGKKDILQKNFDKEKKKEELHPVLKKVIQQVDHHLDKKGDALKVIGKKNEEIKNLDKKNQEKPKVQEKPKEDEDDKAKREDYEKQMKKVAQDKVPGEVEAKKLVPEGFFPQVKKH